jgi:hypothetical protein
MDELQTLRTAVEAAKEVPVKPVMGGRAPSYLSVASALVGAHLREGRTATVQPSASAAHPRL